GMEITPGGHAAEVARIRPRYCSQHQHRVFDAARHRAELVEGPAQRHCAGTGHAPEGWAQSSHPTARARVDDAALGFTTYGEADKPGARGGAWPRARPPEPSRAARDSWSGLRTRC